jgi:hypothetical protein
MVYHGLKTKRYIHNKTMSSDAPNNPNELKAPIAHLQQQQQAQGSESARAPSSLHFSNHQQGRTAPIGDSGASNESNALNSLLSGYLKSKSNEDSSALAQAGLPPQPHHNQTNNSAHQLQNLLESAKLLSSVNPKLASQAMNQALALTSQIIPFPPMAPGPQQHAPVPSLNPQVLSLLNSRQQDNIHALVRMYEFFFKELFFSTTLLISI